MRDRLHIGTEKLDTKCTNKCSTLLKKGGRGFNYEAKGEHMLIGLRMSRAEGMGKNMIILHKL